MGNLLERYQPRTAVSEIKLRRVFTGSELKCNTVNADVYFSQIEHIRQRVMGINMKTEDQEAMIHLLGTLPKSYDGVEMLLEADLGKDTLHLRTMRESL